MLGNANDTKPQNWKGKEAFQHEYAALLASLKSLKSRPKIWACFPPPVYKDESGINAVTLDEMIEATEIVCDRDKIPRRGLVRCPEPASRRCSPTGCIRTPRGPS